MANRDFEELFECLTRRRVKALVVGAHAVAYHAKPRYTKDVDILVEPSIANAERLLLALEDFGLGSLDLTVEDFSSAGKIVQLGYEPNRVDFITSLGKVSLIRQPRAGVEDDAAAELIRDYSIWNDSQRKGIRWSPRDDAVVERCQQNCV